LHEIIRQPQTHHQVSAASFMAGPITARVEAVRPPPPLTIALRGSLVELTWPVSATNFLLTSRAQLSSSLPWTPVAANLEISNDLRRVLVPISASIGQFFRLETSATP
jgi:hypothetical protein